MKTIFMALLCVSLLFAVPNDWTLLPDTFPNRGHLALVYHADSNRFISNMGTVGQNMDLNAYDVQAYLPTQRRWINHLPDPALYGVWADSVGAARGVARMSAGTLYFATITGANKSFLRPNLYVYSWSTGSWGQYAVVPEQQKVYYYIMGYTFAYGLNTRLWDTLSTPIQPSGKGPALIYGSMCYDAHNREVVLFGGAGVDADSGNVGMWALNIDTRTWRKLSVGQLPPPRSMTSMVYDPESKAIVLFGGDHLDYLFADTWVYDCTTRKWTEKKPTISPSPRLMHSMVYLPKSKAIVLLGGLKYSSTRYYDSIPFEMWRYRLAENSWTLIRRYASSETRPIQEPGIDMSQLSGTFVCAAGGNDTIMAMGGIMWRPLRTFVTTCDPNVQDLAGTARYGVVSGTIAYRSGSFDPAWIAGAPAPDTAAVATMLRNARSDRWTVLPFYKTGAREPILNRDWGTSCYDPDHDQILIFGGGHSAYPGNDVAQYSCAKGRWAIGYRPEIPLTFCGVENYYPPYHTYSNRPLMWIHLYDTYDYDRVIKRLVMVKYGKTYFYDPVKMDWDRVINNPFSVNIMTSCVKSTPRGVVCLDGTNKNLYLMSGDSLRWQKLPVTSGALPGWYSDDDGLTYDSRRDEIIIWKYRDQGFRTIYSFKTGAVTKRPNKVFPGAAVRENVYDSTRDMVHFIGYGNSNLISFDLKADTLYTQTIGDTLMWSRTFPTGGHSTSLNYDAGRGLLWGFFPGYALFALSLRNLTVDRENQGAPEIGEPTLSVAPNPFNPTTTIQVHSTQYTVHSHPELKIYDLQGQLVRNLTVYNVLGTMYSYEWNGLTENGKQAASGVYTVELTADGRRLIKKMTLSR